MHLEPPSSKRLNFYYVLEVILTIVLNLCSGVLCVLKLVSTYFPLSQLFYYCMSLIKNNQHTLTIIKLRNHVRLMILLTTICNIVRICMH